MTSGKSPRKQYHDGGPMRLGSEGIATMPSTTAGLRDKYPCRCNGVKRRIDGEPLTSTKRICTSCQRSHEVKS